MRVDTIENVKSEAYTSSDSSQKEVTYKLDIT